MSKYNTIISNFKKKTIVVIGDIILDQHIQGSVSRISPEAPVPVVLQQGNPFYAPGGAANVANNLASLGAKTILIGQIGSDPEGQILTRELKKRKIVTNRIFTDPRLPTILKTRIVAQHQQVLRLDREEIPDSSPNQKINQNVLNFLRKNMDRMDAILISDYGKGMITPELVSKTCSLALSKKKIITVDPKVEHFSYYRGVTAITPNRKEAENAIRNIKITEDVGSHFALRSDRLKTEKEIDTAGEALLDFLKLDSLLMTLGESGMRLFMKGRKAIHINTRAQDVFDVTGAGDTVISVFTLSLTAGATKPQAADLANYAAGVVVGKMGPVSITSKELLGVIKS